MSHPPDRAAFTLIEALVATLVATLAGSALLLSATTAVRTTDDVLERTIAAGMAQQLMDEVVGRRYSAPGSGAYQYPLGPNTSEMVGPGRSRYDDIDDYIAISNKPPKDAWNISLGADDGKGGTRHTNFRVNSTFFNNWRREVDVYYVSNTNLSQRLTGSQTSDYRAVEVSIYIDDPVRGTRRVANARRVVANVPSP